MSNSPLVQFLVTAMPSVTLVSLLSSSILFEIIIIVVIISIWFAHDLCLSSATARVEVRGTPL